MKLALIAATALAVTATPTLAKPKHCPPGLAKKSPSCVPPGLAKNGGGDHDRRDGYTRDDDRYRDHSPVRRGDRVTLDGREYVVVSADRDTIVLRRDRREYRLPRLDDGSEYVRIGDAILRVDRKTKAVFEIIELADLILN